MTQIRIRRVEDGAGDLIRASVSIWLVDADSKRRVAWHSAGGPITEITNLSLNADEIVDLVPQADIALDAAGSPTNYLVRIVAQPEARRHPVSEDWFIQVPDSVDIVELDDLVGATGIEPGSLVYGRLLPLGATSGQIARYSGGSWIPDDEGGGSGAVTKVGTPVDNQVGVWTGDGTIEGTSAFTFNGTTFALTGNMTVSGTVDGRAIATDGTKLDSIETNATADQTAAEIKTAYESNADTNELSDAEKTKLAGIAVGAEANAVDSVNAQTGVVVLDADDVGVGAMDITMEGTNIIFEDDQGDEIMSLPQTMYLVSDAISENAAQIAQNTLDIAALESSQQYVRTGATGEVYFGAGAGVQYNAPLEIDVATVDTEGAVDLVNNQIVLDAVLTSGTAVRYAVVFTASQYTSQIGEFSLFQNDVIVPGTTVTWNMDPDSGADVIVAPNGGVATIGPIVVNGTALTAGARIDVRCGIQGNTKPITVESYQVDISLAEATASGHAIVDQNGDFTPYNSLLQFAGATVTVTDGVVSGGDQDGNQATVVEVGLGPGGTLVDYGEQPQDLGSLSATLTVDISQGQSVLATLTGDVSTVAFQNPTGHTATSFVLLLTTGGFTVTDWSGAVAGWFGSAPDLSTAGVHGVAFELLGGNWYGTYKGLVS